jgi:GTPase SAR1 family protein
MTYLIRLIIVGETGVGKTSLLIRFNEDNFILDQKTTIGVDYKAKEVKIGDDAVKLQVKSGLDFFNFCLQFI